jgi:hypothetical protein
MKIQEFHIYIPEATAPIPSKKAMKYLQKHSQEFYRL